LTSKSSKVTVMIAAPTVVLSGLMHFSTYQLDHVFFGQTRAYTARGMARSHGGSSTGMPTPTIAMGVDFVARITVRLTDT